MRLYTKTIISWNELGKNTHRPAQNAKKLINDKHGVSKP